MRPRRALALVCLFWAAAVGAVAANQVSSIAEELELRRYYLEDGIEISINDMEALVAEYPAVSFVALRSEPEAGADALAADLLSALGEGTILVRTPTEIGTVSSVYDDESLNRALDAVVATTGDDYLTDFGEFASALGSPPESGGFRLGLVALVVVVGFVVFWIWRSNRKRAMDKEDRLEEARQEIRSQMDVIADQILEMADDPRLDEHQQARESYRSGSEMFRGAEARLAQAADLDSLESISDDLDQARWELEVAGAVIEGRTPPERPIDEKPPHCFFDPTHGAGTEQAELKTPAGIQKVWVCKVDADKLRQGEAPQPRTVPMGTGQVPAARAPRSHGGMGLDWLDVFSVIVGGMGSGLPYDWTGQRPRGARGREGWGSRRPGGRSSQVPSSPRPSVRPKGRGRRRL